MSDLLLDLGDEGLFSSLLGLGHQVEDICVDFPPVDGDVVAITEEPQEGRGAACVKDHDLAHLLCERAYTVAHDSTGGGFKAHSFENWELVLDVLVMLLLSLLSWIKLMMIIPSQYVFQIFHC